MGDCVTENHWFEVLKKKTHHKSSIKFYLSSLRIFYVVLACGCFQSCSSTDFTVLCAAWESFNRPSSSSLGLIPVTSVLIFVQPFSWRILTSTASKHHVSLYVVDYFFVATVLLGNTYSNACLFLKMAAFVRRMCLGVSLIKHAISSLPRLNTLFCYWLLFIGLDDYSFKKQTCWQLNCFFI